MASLAIITPQIDPLAELQRRYCLIKLGGEVRLIDRDQLSAIQSGRALGALDMYRDRAANLLLARELEALPVASKPQVIKAAFWVSPNTHVFDAVAFDPRPQGPNVLNYWSPPPAAPRRGDWSVVRDFLRDVICSGNQKHYDYLLRYIAHMLQRPEEKPGVMLVLLGGQGTGKGTLFRLLGKLWPRTMLQVSDVAHVVGQFNAAMERNYVICMDEALFSGDRKAMDRLKSLITEPDITVEQKYEPRRTIRSFHRFFAASNHDHFGRIDVDDRRFVFLRTSTDRQRDHDYFGQIYRALETESVLAALTYDLLALDLTHFNVRDRPVTAENTEQKVRSLEGFDRYWFEVLCTGDLGATSAHGSGRVWTDSVFVPTSMLVAGSRGFQQGVRQHQPLQSREISRALGKWCPEATSSRSTVHRQQVRGYQLPALQVARTSFEKAAGGQIIWQDGPEKAASR
jgi:hypothetical protein